MSMLRAPNASRFVHKLCPPLAPWLRAGHRREPSGARARRERGLMRLRSLRSLRTTGVTVLARFARRPGGRFPTLAGLDAPPATFRLPSPGGLRPLSRLRAPCGRLGVACGPAALGPPLCGVKIDSGGRLCRPPFADPFLALLGRGIGRLAPPSFSSFAPVAALPALGVRPYFFARYAPKKIDGPPPESGGPRAASRPRRPGLRPPLVTGPWGGLSVATLASLPAPS